MSELSKSPETGDELAIQLAVDAYSRWQALKGIAGVGEERQKDYEQLRHNLSEVAKLELDKRIAPQQPEPQLAGEEVAEDQ